LPASSVIVFEVYAMKDTRIALATSLLVLVATLLLPPVAAGQAYCALRDPTPQIFSLYPEAKSYRSNVGVVDDKTRREVGSLLSFSLHSRELGQHTLYIAMAGKQQLGMVHVRSEPSDWGLVEIAWSIDVAGRISDFRFQRCRGGACKDLDSEPVRSMMRGRGLKELRGLLSADSESLAAAELPNMSGEQRRLAAVLVRSAAKTLAVTKIVWGPQLQQISAMR
jgi:hypothetical protein